MMELAAAMGGNLLARIYESHAAEIRFSVSSGPAETASSNSSGLGHRPAFFSAQLPTQLRKLRDPGRTASLRAMAWASRANASSARSVSVSKLSGTSGRLLRTRYHQTLLHSL